MVGVTTVDFPALQLAVVPPFVPEQLHVYDEELVTEDAVPEVQRLVVGVDERVWLLDEPQVPLVGDGVGVGVVGVVTTGVTVVPPTGVFMSTWISVAVRAVL